MSLVVSSIYISILAMGVIFVVLGTLIALIKVLDRCFPYQAPPPAPVSARPAAGAADEEAEHLAVIHAVLSRHLEKDPSQIHLTRVSSP